MWQRSSKPDRFVTKDEASSCSGKIGFDNRHVARMVAEKSKKGVATSYHCQFCGKWHLAEMSTKERKRRKK